MAVFSCLRPLLPAFGISFAVGVLGFKMLMVTSPDFLYSQVIPAIGKVRKSFERLAVTIQSSTAIRYLRLPLKILLIPLKVTLLLAKWPARLIFATLRLTFGVIVSIVTGFAVRAFDTLPFSCQVWVMKALHSADDWVMKGKVLEDQRIGPFVFKSVFPFLGNGPYKMLLSLSDHINHADEESHCSKTRSSVLERYKDFALDHDVCVFRCFNKQAAVELISTSIGPMIPPDKDSRQSRQEQNQKLRSTLHRRLKPRLKSIRTMRNWRISRTAKLQSMSKPRRRMLRQLQRKSLEIGLWSSVDQNLTRKTSSVFLEGITELLEKEIYRHWIINIPKRRMAWHLHRNANDANIKIECGKSAKHLESRAMGSSLIAKTPQRVGYTYVSKDFIRFVMGAEQARRTETGQDQYDLFTNNCHTLWTNGLLDLIVCRCTRPGNLLSIAQSSLVRDWQVAQAELAMSVLISLWKRGYLPFRLGFLWWWPSVLVCIFQEFDFIFYGPVIPAIMVQDRTRSLSLLSILLLHLGSSLSYHWNPLPTMFEWIDICIGLISAVWIRSIRQKMLEEKPPRPRICWSGFFAQMYEKSQCGDIDKTQLTEDMKAYLHTDL